MGMVHDNLIGLPTLFMLSVSFFWGAIHPKNWIVPGQNIPIPKLQGLIGLITWAMELVHSGFDLVYIRGKNKNW